MSTPSTLLKTCRPQIAAVMLFSGFANILQLTTSVYMMQVFDRVMNGRSLDTLVYLTLIAAVVHGAPVPVPRFDPQSGRSISRGFEYRVRRRSPPRTSRSSRSVAGKPFGALGS